MMRTNFFLLAILATVFTLYGCPIFVDTTPPVKKITQQEPFNVPDSLYYYDPNYFVDLDIARPYQVPSNIRGFESQWVMAQEFAGSSSVDQIVWRVTHYGLYCITDSLCECVRTQVMFPGDIFHLANMDSILVGDDKVYFGDNPWKISKRILENDSLQYWWQEQNALQKEILILKDSSSLIGSLIKVKEGEVRKESWQRYTIFALVLLILFFSFYYRKELVSLAKKVT